MSGTILPDPTRLHLAYLRAQGESITVVVATTGEGALCPLCGQPSARVHSRYIRRLADLPWNGVAVQLELTVRRFFCDSVDCRRKIFAEPLPGLVAPYARRTMRLTEAMELIGFALGGEAGARVLVQLSMSTSPDTVLRVVRAAALPEPETPRVLGVDDWAFRRGRRYGSILVDLERRCRIDLLPDRTAESLAKWLRDHPGVEIVARDRAGAYADGVAQGAPQAVQVADRWHLAKNLGDALEEFFSQMRPQLLTIYNALPPNQERSGASPLAGSRAQKEEQRRRRGQRLECYLKLRELRERGVTIKDAARAVDIGERTANRWIAAGTFPERRVRCRTPAALDEHEEYIRHRWDEGCRNRAQIWREICERGYTGPRHTIYQYIVRLRAGVLATTQTSPPRAHAPPVRGRPLSPRQAAWLLLRGENVLDAGDCALLDAVRRACPDAAMAYELVQRFLTMLRERALDSLDRWLGDAEASAVRELERFAAGLRRDEAAVRAALTWQWSGGQTEGQVNRLKLIKRQGYGRANFDLLRKRVLGAA